MDVCKLSWNNDEDALEGVDKQLFSQRFSTMIWLNSNDMKIKAMNDKYWRGVCNEKRNLNKISK
jgi:hypothetical protein